MKPVVLITGSSRGIGAAVALLAAQAGWAVAVNYARQADKAQALVDQIKAQGGQAVALQADIGVASDIAPFLLNCNTVILPLKISDTVVINITY